MGTWRGAAAWLSVTGWRAACWLLRALPVEVSYRLATLVGAATFVLWPRGRRATLANFAIVLRGAPESQVRRTARRSLEQYCRYLVDFARLSGPHSRTPAITGGLEQLDKLKRVLGDGRGAVLVLTHSGNWDAAAAATARAGVDVAVVAEAVGSPQFDRMVRQARERLGMRVLLMGRDTLAMARTLRTGGMLAVLIDRPDPAGGAPITFFGRKTHVPDGAARLALRNGAHVIAAGCRRRHGSHDYALYADFDIPIPGDPADGDAPRQLTQAIFAAHERFIRAQPSQWYMFRRFWPEEEKR